MIILLYAVILGLYGITAKMSVGGLNGLIRSHSQHFLLTEIMKILIYLIHIHKKNLPVAKFIVYQRAFFILCVVRFSLLKINVFLLWAEQKVTINHIALLTKNWWKQELPDTKEYGEAYKNLEKYNYTVDYVISHSIPSQYLPSLSNGSDEFYSNHLTDFFDEIELKLDYKHWFSGHYHCDKTLATNSKITLIYNDIIKL